MYTPRELLASSMRVASSTEVARLVVDLSPCVTVFMRYFPPPFVTYFCWAYAMSSAC